MSEGNGLTIKEVSKLLHSVLNLSEGDIVVSLAKDVLSFIATPLYVDANLLHEATDKDGKSLRVVSAACLIIHPDGSFECAEINLSYLAGKDVYLTKQVAVKTGKTGNLYFAYHDLESVHSTKCTLPIAHDNAYGFESILALEVKGSVQGYKELPLEYSFVRTGKGGSYINSKFIVEHQKEMINLPACTRPCFVKAACPRITKAMSSALIAFQKRLTGQD